MAEVETIVIAGSGCAGLSAAIYAARAQLHPLVLEGPQVGGALTQSAQVDNFPGFPEGIRGSDLMKRMRQQAERFDTRFSSTSVQQALLGEKNQKMLTLSNGQTIATQTLIIATGSQANTLHLPREKELLCGKGLSVCATCDGFFYKHETVVVIGDGEEAYKDILYLSSLCTKVYWVPLKRTQTLSDDPGVSICQKENVECLEQQVPIGFSTDSEGLINGLQLQKAGETYLLPCKGVFLAIGHTNSQAFKGFVEMDEQGYISIADKAVCTNVPGVFAAGDCVDRRYRQAVVAASMGAQAALEAKSWLREHHE